MEASLGLNISFGEAPEHKQRDSLISFYTVTKNQAHFLHTWISATAEV